MPHPSIIGDYDGPQIIAKTVPPAEYRTEPNKQTKYKSLNNRPVRWQMLEEDLPADLQEDSGPVRTELERLTDDYLSTKVGTDTSLKVLCNLSDKLRA